MKLSVHFHSETHTFHGIEHEHTVGQLKQYIEEHFGIAYEDQDQLMYNGKRLCSIRTLWHYGIKDGDTLSIAVLFGVPLHLDNVTADTLVFTIKCKTARLLGVTHDRLQVYYDDKQLQDGLRLSDYNIDPDADIRELRYEVWPRVPRTLARFRIRSRSPRRPRPSSTPQSTRKKRRNRSRAQHVPTPQTPQLTDGPEIVD